MFFRHLYIRFNPDRSVFYRFRRSGPPLHHYTIEHPFHRVSVEGFFRDNTTLRWRSNLVWPGWRRIRPKPSINAKWCQVTIRYVKKKKLQPITHLGKPLLLFEDRVTVKSTFGTRIRDGHFKFYLGWNLPEAVIPISDYMTLVPSLSSATLDGSPLNVHELHRKVFRQPKSILQLKLVLDPESCSKSKSADANR